MIVLAPQCLISNPCQFSFYSSHVSCWGDKVCTLLQSRNTSAVQRRGQNQKAFLGSACHCRGWSKISHLYRGKTVINQHWFPRKQPRVAEHSPAVGSFFSGSRVQARGLAERELKRPRCSPALPVGIWDGFASQLSASSPVGTPAAGRKLFPRGGGEILFFALLRNFCCLFIDIFLCIKLNKHR